MRAQVAHRWAQDELEGATVDVRTLDGQRMGIVGLGAIGLELVKIAAPFGFRDLRDPPARRPSRSPRASTRSGRPIACPTSSRRATSSCSRAPHTPETKRLIGPRELDRMKRGALLVNVARGKLVDDDAVIEALRDGRLGGAALDVFSEEPLDRVEPVLGSAERHRHAAHVRGDAGLLDAARGAVHREPAPFRKRRAACCNVVDKKAGY